MSKEPPGLLTSSLKMDMMHFKDEILHDMRQNQSKLDFRGCRSFCVAILGDMIYNDIKGG